MRTSTNSASARPRRTPVNERNVLTVKGKEEGYVYRIVNDEGGRVQQFLDAGYELVNAKDVEIGDKRVNAATAEGSIAEVYVGGGKKAKVMRIKKEWYDEDQAAKQKRVDELEKAIKQQASQAADYGSVTITRN